jgi:hypothetical protein
MGTEGGEREREGRMGILLSLFSLRAKMELQVSFWIL